MTETVEPPGFARDPDPTRVVNVTSGTPNVVIGSSLAATPHRRTTAARPESGRRRRSDVQLLQPDPREPADDLVGEAAALERRPRRRRNLHDRRRHDRALRLLRRSHEPLRDRGQRPVRRQQQQRPDPRRGRLLRQLHGHGDDRAFRPHAGPGPDAPRQRHVRKRFGRHRGSAQECSTSSPPNNGDSNPGVDSEEADFCNPAITARTLNWEKRAASGGSTIGGATFSVGGASGPFACTGDPTNPVTVVDAG